MLQAYKLCNTQFHARFHFGNQRVNNNTMFESEKKDCILQKSEVITTINIKLTHDF